MSNKSMIDSEQKTWRFWKRAKKEPDKAKDEDFYRAGQWQLVWWKFKRHKLADRDRHGCLHVAQVDLHDFASRTGARILDLYAHRQRISRREALAAQAQVVIGQGVACLLEAVGAVVGKGE